MTRCKSCGKELNTVLIESKGEWYCSVDCLKLYQEGKEMKDYDREYSIQEVFEFKEGTEFVSDEMDLVVIKSECLINSKTDVQWMVGKNTVNSKFKLKRKERKVDFMEAYQYQGKLRLEHEYVISGAVTDSFIQIMSYLIDFLGINNDCFIKVISEGNWYILD